MHVPELYSLIAKLLLFVTASCFAGVRLSRCPISRPIECYLNLIQLRESDQRSSIVLNSREVANSLPIFRGRVFQNALLVVVSKASMLLFAKEAVSAIK